MQFRGIKLLNILRLQFTLAAAAIVYWSVSLAQVAPPPQPVPNGPPPIISQPLQRITTEAFLRVRPPRRLALSLRDSIQRGLKYNLGILTNQDTANLAAIERRRTLGTLLPSLSAGATQASEQIDLVAFGLSLPGFPSVVGPFGYQDARAYFSKRSTTGLR